MHVLDGEHSRLEKALDEVRANRNRVRQSPPAEVPRTDFAATLPRGPDGADVLRRLQSLCNAQGVSLGNVDIDATAPTAESLGKVTLRGVLTGSYVQTKRVLAELLGQLPGAALESARWRAGDASRPAELNLSVTVWSAPLAGAGGASSTSGARQQ